MEGKFVSYYRVSTQKQGLNGLGMEAQKQAVMEYLNGGRWVLLKEFTEVETDKGSNALVKRPELQNAINYAKKQKATLVIAKLGKLARNVHFVSSLMESGVDFIAVDNPTANRLTLHILAAVAEDEARRISERTKSALAAKKARGEKMGNPQSSETLNAPRIEKANANAEKIRPLLENFLTQGISQRAMADELNRLCLTTPRGSRWKQAQVQRALKRLGLEE